MVETGGDEKQAAKLTKELRAAAQKAKTEFDTHRTARQTSQRWSSTDEDYMPERRQSRSSVHDDLDSGSRTSRDSRSWTDSRGDEYPSSRQQWARNEDGYRLRRYSRVYDDDDGDGDGGGDGHVGNSVRRTKANQNRSSHTSSPCKLMLITTSPDLCVATSEKSVTICFLI